jgi:hypothetical protein
MTIHDEARSAAEAIYDQAIADLEVRAVALEAQVADFKAQATAAETRAVESEAVVAELNAQLREPVGAALTDPPPPAAAEIARLRQAIADLEDEAVPAGWKVLYASRFDKDDGWTEAQETQNNDNSYNTPANVKYGDGLTLFARREVAGGRPYTSADILGRHVRTPNYFRAEVVATLPTEYGTWPCPLWFRPLTHGSDGEIDVCETWPFDWGTRPRAYATIWEKYTPARKSNNGPDGLLYSALPNPDPAARHTYVVEKTPGRIEFLIDGVRAYCWEAGATYSATKRIAPLPSWYASIFEIAGREWYPRITMQLGGNNAREPLADWQESRMVIHSLRILTPA